MSAHTPGPWQLAGIFGPDAEVVDVDGFAVAEAAEYKAIRWGWSDLYPDLDHWASGTHGDDVHQLRLSLMPEFPTVEPVPPFDGGAA